MAWFNPFGLLFIAVIMIPNIVFAIKCKDGFENLWSNKAVETFEQIGRFGCFFTMIINIPGTAFGFRSDEAFALYLIIDAVLVLAYCGIWIICFKRNSIFRALALSIIPSVIFLFSGIMSRSVMLIIFAVIFAPCHILISYRQQKGSNSMDFYHGTTTAFELRVGGYLLPAIETGNLREDWRKKHTDKVFSTPSLLSAEKYAKKAAVKYGGEPIVYTVKPSVPYYNINTNEYISDRARILAVKEILITKPIKKSLPKSRDHFFAYSITCPYRNAS